MNYKQAAIDDLRNHAKRKEALRNIKDKIAALQAQYEASKTNTYGAAPVNGGASQTEDRWVNNIMERERLKVAYAATKRLVDIVERGLEGLTDEEREVLLEVANLRGRYDAEAVAARHNMSRRTFFRVKDEALYKLTITMYGVSDL